MIAGISGGVRNATVALAAGGRLVGVCSQERATRARGAGVNASGMPDEALDLLLHRLGHSRDEITRYVVARDHHFGHACTAYYTSPFASAAIVVCDHDEPDVTVWTGEGASLRQVEWPWQGEGFARTFSRFSAALGFQTPDADPRAEALARLHPESTDPEVDRCLRRGPNGLVVDPGLYRYLESRIAADRNMGSPVRAALASALHRRLGTLFVELLGEVRERLGVERLCLGGNYFYHSSVNTRVKQSGLFADVFLPVDPGDTGLAVGVALEALGRAPSPASPFMGPSYSAEETKGVLDNCKLQYSWETEEGATQAAVSALQDGRLVAWFDGQMEWGPRALGARCILANPTAPYVLENLNHFLKRRESWRGYALSGLQDAVQAHFDGPPLAPFMECDYIPRDPSQFRHVLPSASAAVRVQTVTETGSLPRFRRLLDACGEASGLPFLVNTSFNGFHEPIVCSPRDAVRVFYGTGLDVLVINQFVLRK